MKRKFTKDFLRNTLGLPYETYTDEVEIIEDEIDGHSRWSVSHRLIFKFENKYYLTYYSVGATESQEESPWEYDDIVECVEVKPVERIIIDWEPV